MNIGSKPGEYILLKRCRNAEIVVPEVVRHFSKFIGRVRFYGEYIVLTRGGKPTAELQPTLEGVVVRAGDLPTLFTQLPNLRLQPWSVA